MPEHAVIGYVTGGLNRNEFTTSLVGLTRSATVIDDVIAWVSGPNISRARNMVVAGFLEDHDAPWLFMCDTDMSLPRDTIDRLIVAADPQDRPVVGGLCFTENPGGDGPLPTLYEMVLDEHRQPVFARRERWPDDGLVQVTATGAACLLIHRDALELVAKTSQDKAAPWFRESVVGESLIGEDLTFCLRLGVAEIPVYVHTGVKAGHMKTAMLI